MTARNVGVKNQEENLRISFRGFGRKKEGPEQKLGKTLRKEIMYSGPRADSTLRIASIGEKLMRKRAPTR
jgi:hypothetical protein